MNKLTIIGNLTRDPDVRTLAGGEAVTSFTVAVNRRTNKDHPEADYFRVSAWGKLGEHCANYLSKGRKVAVIGSVRATAYCDQSGNAKASLDVTAQEVEFLSSRQQDAEAAPAAAEPVPAELTDDDIPF